MTARGACLLALATALLGASGLASRAATPVVVELERVEPRSQLGSYLAGRYARGQHDTPAAASYYKRALERDPGNETLLKQAFVTEVTAGNWTRASALADELVTYEASHRIARLYLGVREFRAGALDKADEHFTAAGTGPIGELTSALARAWVKAAQGDLKGASDHIDGLKQADWAVQYQRFHKALIADVLGKKQIARQGYEKIFETDARSLRPALGYGAHAAHWGNPDITRRVLGKQMEGNPPGHPLARAMLDQVNAGQSVPLLVENATEGLAESFYGLGEVLASEGGLEIGTIYLQLALLLRPDAPLALAALANVYESTKQYEQAIATYARIPQGSPLASSVVIRKAFNLNQLDQVDEAKSILEQLAGREPKDLRPLDALGNIMRARKRFEEASRYYSQAIKLIDKPGKAHWNNYYSRGVCYERMKNWPAAEADLVKALELNPDQPLVLNYLGYSWVDQNRHLQKAMAYIAKAVKLKPDDGYFVDSLGWAHYRLGDFKQATAYLERAVELRPEDPTINDHLGDALWRVGRTLEARYQWEQALTLKPEPEEIDKIKKKVAEGLPMLKAEAAPPNKKKREVRRAEPRQKRAEKTDTIRPVQ
jgi:tetratricopeptide (TPR) repeat protein